MWIPKDVGLIRGRHLFEAQRLLEEIRYFISVKYHRDNIHIIYDIANYTIDAL